MLSRRQLIRTAAALSAAPTLPLALTGCVTTPSVPADPTRVRVKGGWLQGARSTRAEKVVVFRNVPFGENPYTPERRFLAPVPAAPWEGVRDATKAGGVPLQPARDGSDMIGGGDALVLNVWAPDALEAPASQPGGYPVMVWIPGGGSTNCDNNDPRFDGSAFARDGVVLVTLNYRVNVDGFLKLEGGDADNGIRDMILGLEWVRDNIAAFGGDPSRVTVFGQSAGGTHLTSLLASPLARGLFSQAIVQSPSAVAQWADATAADHAAKTFAQKLGIAPTRDAFLAFPTEDLIAMRKVVGGLAQDENWGRFTKGNTAVFKPFVDGEVLTQRPVDAIRAGAASDVRVLAGCTREEWRHYLVPSGSIAKVGETEINRLIRTSDQKVSLGEAYRLAGHGRTPGDIFARMQSDLIFRMPCNKLLESLAVAGNDVWAYSFDWRSPVLGKTGAEIGAAHSCDVPFVFETLDTEPARKANGPDAPQSLAAEMHAAWVRFAKMGNPGWAKFDAEKRFTRLFDEEVRTHSDPWAFERKAMRIE